MTDDAFIAFWTIWRGHCRKTDGRGKARPAWLQMIGAGADPQDIIDGAVWYLRNMSERDAPYIPLASSWLRSERWADDCEQERAFQARLAEAQQRRAAPAPQPIPEPVQAPQEDRAAIARRVFERQGLPLPESFH